MGTRAKAAGDGDAGAAAIDDTVVIEDLMRQQGAALQALFAPLMTGAMAGNQVAPPEPGDLQHWAMSAAKLQKMWLDFGAEQAGRIEPLMARFADPESWPRNWNAWGQMWTSALGGAGANPAAGIEPAAWLAQMPMVVPAQKQMWDDGLALWTTILGRMGSANAPAAALPRKDRRFADPQWSDQPVFALIHQTYLLLAERLGAMADDLAGVPPERREQMRFMVKVLTEAMSPANFPLTNPLVIQRTMETKGENLVRGVEHLLSDLRKGQLTHTRLEAFELGTNIAATPGKVVHETPLLQLLQFSPVTDTVNAVPLLIFPSWINRYYILDLNPANSFIRWAVAQGLTVFVVSWKSADATMADLSWDDYVLAQIAAIDLVRARLKVPAVHTIGYCVAGTTLAATLAVLARRNQADKVASATFLTAQVDFEHAGDLKNFIDDGQLQMIEKLATDGYLDGRYLAMAFNMLRSSDLVWNYVVNNYLMGEDYPEFDLLYWNGDTTNLPFKWLRAYLIELYRDNRLIEPDSLSIDGTPIDLTRIATPCYIQAGRLDHIAPAQSVWKLTQHLAGPYRFVLAGSGHIAGVVNPPASGKYQYWLNPGAARTLDEFIAGAAETKGSWWPDWIEWICAFGTDQVPAKGKRAPGGRGDKAIADAPGSYVRTR
ncbi:PHA/PHB synthase family protein [Novosphingobium sp.]|uniref:PHA/PHB synthase family protein n=1 Tax=Novosphingobium sp. TaxID=1874826 RepID=UPI003D11B541